MEAGKTKPLEQYRGAGRRPQRTHVGRAGAWTKKKKKKGESARPRKGREKHEAAESDHWGLEV